MTLPTPYIVTALKHVKTHTFKITFLKFRNTLIIRKNSCLDF